MTEPALDSLKDLYGPLSENDPAGEALERTAFLNLEELCNGKPGGYDHMNERDLPPTPPNFRSARTEALKLLGRTRDLRPLCFLVEVEANLTGPLGLHAALHLLAKTIEDQWEQVNPGPADDSQAESLRRRALDRLRERRNVVVPLEEAQIVAADGDGGALEVRDLLLTAEAIQPREGEQAMDRARLVERIQPEAARTQVAQVRAAMEASAEIYAALDARLAELMSRPIALGPVGSELARLAQAIKGFEDEAEGAPAPDGDAAGAEDDAGGEAEAAPSETGASAPAGKQGIGGLNNDDDANTLLEDMIAYYAANAPSSPIALILLKVHDLRNAGFAEWIRATGSNGPDKSALDLSDVDTSRLMGGGDGEEAEANGGSGDIAAELEQGCEALQQALNATGERYPDLQDRIDEMSKLVERVPAALRAAASGGGTPAAIGQVNSRAMVKNALEQLARYRETRDPASPVPTILRRTKGLVDLNYLDILTEMSPSGGDPALPLIKPEPKGR